MATVHDESQPFAMHQFNTMNGFVEKESAENVLKREKSDLRKRDYDIMPRKVKTDKELIRQTLPALDSSKSVVSV